VIPVFWGIMDLNLSTLNRQMDMTVQRGGESYCNDSIYHAHVLFCFCHTGGRVEYSGDLSPNSTSAKVLAMGTKKIFQRLASFSTTEIISSPVYARWAFPSPV
jgi:hypothetical protein